MPAAIAAVATIDVARWHGPVGLDFQGGAQLVVHPHREVDRALTPLRDWLDHQPGLGDVSVLRRGDDEIEIEINREDRALVQGLADRLAAGERFEICDVAASPTALGARTVRSASGESLVIVEPPLFDGEDVRSVQQTDMGVLIDFTDPDRVADVTGARIDKKLAIVLGDILLMAPIVHDRIRGTVQITDPTTPPAVLAARLEAALAPAVDIRNVMVIEHSRPSWQGIPLALALGALAIVLALVAAVPRASRFALVAAAAPLAWIVAVAVCLAMGWTLTIGVTYSAALVAVPAAAAAVLAARAAGGAWPRVNATWPAMAAFAVIAFVVPRFAGKLEPGPWRAAFRFAAWPALVVALVAAIVAISLPARDDASRG